MVLNIIIVISILQESFFLFIVHTFGFTWLGIKNHVSTCEGSKFEGSFPGMIEYEKSIYKSIVLDSEQVSKFTPRNLDSV